MGFRVHGLGVKELGLGLRVEDLGFRNFGVTIGSDRRGVCLPVPVIVEVEEKHLGFRCLQ